MSWYGGKSAYGTGTGRWVAGLLPKTRNKKQCYVEPFAGMLGVLLQRPIQPLELVNDLDGHVANWWLAVRDEPDEMKRQLELTPVCRQHFLNAHELLEATAKIQAKVADVPRAVAFLVAVQGSVLKASGRVHSFGMNFTQPSQTCHPNKVAKSIHALAKRLGGVQIENQEACRLLERVADLDDPIVYCDPPYVTADTTAYAIGDGLDLERFAAAVKGIRGAVAISGYGEEWDHLGWFRSENPTYVQSMGQHAKNTASPRTEVLWTNYDPDEAFWKRYG